MDRNKDRLVCQQSRRVCVKTSVAPNRTFFRTTLLPIYVILKLSSAPGQPPGEKPAYIFGAESLNSLLPSSICLDTNTHPGIIILFRPQTFDGTSIDILMSAASSKMPTSKSSVISSPIPYTFVLSLAPNKFSYAVISPMKQ